MNKKGLNLNEKDKYGLYIHAENYQQVRDEIDGMHKYLIQKKLNRIPKWIRIMFNAI